MVPEERTTLSSTCGRSTTPLTVIAPERAAARGGGSPLGAPQERRNRQQQAAAMKGRDGNMIRETLEVDVKSRDKSGAGHMEHGAVPSTTGNVLINQFPFQRFRLIPRTCQRAGRGRGCP